MVFRCMGRASLRPGSRCGLVHGAQRNDGHQGGAKLVCHQLVIGRRAAQLRTGSTELVFCAGVQLQRPGGVGLGRGVGGHD